MVFQFRIGTGTLRRSATLPRERVTGVRVAEDAHHGIVRRTPRSRRAGGGRAVRDDDLSRVLAVPMPTPRREMETGHEVPLATLTSAFRSATADSVRTVLHGFGFAVRAGDEPQSGDRDR